MARLCYAQDKPGAVGAGLDMGAMVALVWWQNVELTCVELTFVCVNGI